MPLKYSPTEIARQFLFLREASQNRGQRVEAVQHWSGGQPGDSWCAEFATMVLDICFQGSPPIGRERAVQSIYDQAKKEGWMTGSPVQDDLFIYVNDQDHAHHIGFVTNGNGTIGIAGNTSADGKSSNGDRVAEHGISQGSHVKYIHYPR